MSQPSALAANAGVGPRPDGVAGGGVDARAWSVGSVLHWPWSQPCTCRAASAVAGSAWSVRRRTSGARVPPPSSLRPVELEDPADDVAHRVALGVGRRPEHGGDELLGLAAPEPIVGSPRRAPARASICAAASRAGEVARRRAAGSRSPTAMPLTPSGSNTLISPRCSRAFKVARRRSVLTDETMAGPVQASTPAIRPVVLPDWTGPEHARPRLEPRAGPATDAPSVDEELAAPAGQHEPAGLRPAWSGGVGDRGSWPGGPGSRRRAVGAGRAARGGRPKSRIRTREPDGRAGRRATTASQ